MSQLFENWIIRYKEDFVETSVPTLIRNLVPAKIGSYSLLFMCIYGSFYCAIYSVPVDLGFRVATKFLRRFYAFLGHYRFLSSDTRFIYNRFFKKDSLNLQRIFVATLFWGSWKRSRRPQVPRSYFLNLCWKCAKFVGSSLLQHGNQSGSDRWDWARCDLFTPS